MFIFLIVYPLSYITIYVDSIIYFIQYLTVYPYMDFTYEFTIDTNILYLTYWSYVNMDVWFL